MFDKLLVANRGEIAIRIMAACEELDIGTVAIYSDADRESEHVAYADEAYRVGPPQASESYLDQERIIEVSKEAQADAIHPGYGFLAENAEFAEQVEATDGIKWIGPSSDAMQQLGSKTSARETMQAADVPIVPGTTTSVDNPDEVVSIAEEYGYPITIKAAGGGGGRGMQIVQDEYEIEDALETAKREGEAYFDDAEVYVEKYLSDPKHIEVQILADESGNVLHLGERDCSLQRRHQKVIEEAPSPTLSQSLRKKIGNAAKRGMHKAGYTNAGTVEFLVEDGKFYFMEVNTRIQVEHTVTEEITGIDIVKWQIRIAAGETLPYDQSDITFNGHAIQYRVNAEDPASEFAPTPGKLETYRPPSTIGVRIDHAVFEGQEVSGDYDSMIGKLIVESSSRTECINRSKRALRHFDIDGIQTTLPFHQYILNDNTFRDGAHTTKYVDQLLKEDSFKKAIENRSDASVVKPESDEPSMETVSVEVDGELFDVQVEGLSSNNTRASQSTSENPIANKADEGGIQADMEGTVISVDVEEGEHIDQGETVCVLEAMKMENEITANHGGIVSEINVSEGDSVNMGEQLVQMG